MGLSSAEFSVWARGQDPTWLEEVFALCAGTSPDEMKKLTDDIIATDTYTKHTADLSEFFDNPGVCAAIRHYNVTDVFKLNVDDVEAAGTYPLCTDHHLELVPAGEATEAAIKARFAEESTITVKPLYTPAEEEPVTVTVTSGSTHKVSCRTAGCTLIEQGMLYAKGTEGLNEENFVYGTAGVLKYVSNDTAPNGILTANVKVTNDNMPVSFRGCMIVRDDSTGSETIYYTGTDGRTYSGQSGNN